jgi:DNA-binding MarR family transcriptional regulator
VTAVYQPSLLDAQRMPASNDTPESIAAAVAAIPRVTPQKLRILAFLETQPDGAIQEKIADSLGMPQSTVNPRINEMADDHWVEPAGVGKTKYGNSARAWVIGDRGREALKADPASQNAAGVTATNGLVGKPAAVARGGRSIEGQRRGS